MSSETEREAPHLCLRDASFCIAWSGEGAAASVVSGGWGAMLKAFAEGIWMDGDTSHHRDEWSGWLELLSELDEWAPDEGGEPYCFESDVGEITKVTIYRLAAHPAEPPRTVTGDGAGELPKPIHVWSAIHDWHASHEWNGRMEAEAQVERAVREYARAAVAQALKNRSAGAPVANCTYPKCTGTAGCSGGACSRAQPGPAALTDKQICQIAKDVWRQVDGGRPYPGWNVVFARAVLAASQP